MVRSPQLMRWKGISTAESGYGDGDKPLVENGIVSPARSLEWRYVKTAGALSAALAVTLIGGGRVGPVG